MVRKREKLITTIWIFAGLAIWFMIIKSYAYFISPHIGNRIPEIYRLCISSMIVPYAIALPILWLIVRNVSVNNFNIHNNTITKAHYIKIIIIQSGISMLVTIIANMVLMGIGYGTNNSLMKSVKEHLIFYSFLLLIFNPIFEEFLFRKIVLGRLLKWGEKYAILVSAIFFAIPHVVSQGVPQMFYTFVLGCVWGYLTIKTGKITAAILLHSFSNIWGMFLPMLLIQSKIGSIWYMMIWVIIVPCIGIFLLVREVIYKKAEKVIVSVDEK